jgi:hypothetical protein
MSAFALSLRPLGRPRVEAALAGCVALAIAVAILALGPAPGDAPAHLYRTLLVQRGDFVWDNLWFEGIYPLADYSVLYYLPAALVGNLALVLLSVALSAWLFARICLERWGASATWPARLAGVLCAAPAFTGLYAYSLGFVAMLGALRALQRGRTIVFGALAALTLGFSPLAFLFLLLLLVASFAARPQLTRRTVVVAAIVGGLALLEALLLRLFPSSGVYPFNAADYGCLLALCACGALLVRRAEGGRFVAAFFVVWAASATLAFATPSPIGDNVTRLRALVLPVMLLAAILARFRPRWLAVLALTGAFAYNLVPYLMLIPYRLDTRPQHSAFWAPALRFLAAHENADYRVEVVETAANWESYWFPRAGLPLVRGWYRQLDRARNPVLFDPGATGREYAAWLRSVGVHYVVVPHTTLDPAVGSKELTLVRRARSDLRLVLSAPTVTVYELRDPTPIVTGPGLARVTQLTDATIDGTVSAPGAYRLRLEATPYMRVQFGPVCIDRARDGLTTLVARSAGSFELAVPENPLALLGGGSSRCHGTTETPAAARTSST